MILNWNTHICMYVCICICVWGSVCVCLCMYVCVYKVLFFLIFLNSIDKSIGSKYYKRECLLTSKTKMKDFIRLWLAKWSIIRGKPFYIHHTSDLSKSKEETRKFEFRNIFCKILLLRLRCILITNTPRDSS